MKLVYQKLFDRCKEINWGLLLFLVLFLNVKTGVKIIVIILLLGIYGKKLAPVQFLKQKYTWFYVSMIAIALVNLLVNIPSTTVNYLAVAAAGIGFWLLCILAAAITYAFVKNNDSLTLNRTISFFFIINALFTLAQLAFIMWDAGSLNPYRYQGMNQKYFIGTGDLLTGILFDVSTTNAILNAIAVLYFLDRRKFHWLLLSLIVMLLTASNFTNLLLFTILLYQFFFQSDRNQKSVIIVCFCMPIAFLSKISPQNVKYVNYVWQKVTGGEIEVEKPQYLPPLLTSLPDSVLHATDKKRKIAMLYLDSIRASLLEKNKKEYARFGQPEDLSYKMAVLEIKPSIPTPNIHTPPFQARTDTTPFRKKLIDFAITSIPGFDTSSLNLQKQSRPGKLLALQQTLLFLKNNPLKILTGEGTGQFSSKLAFRATGLQLAGSYPGRLTYINDDFRHNHLHLYLLYFTKSRQFHSLMNSPDSVYDQLISEYGIAGVVCFLFFYAGYFIKHHRKKSYGLSLLLLMTGAFTVGYWFEQLSIVIIFEFLLLLNFKETKEQQPV